MSKFTDRLRKVERARFKASALPQLVLWEDLDGSYSFDGQKWASVGDILEAYPNRYNPDNVMSFSWKGRNARETW